MSVVKFNKHAVTDGAVVARVHYYAHRLLSNGDAVVTVTAKDPFQGPLLCRVFAGLYENHTDLREDYFENGRVRIRKGHPLYAAAFARAALNGCVE